MLSHLPWLFAWNILINSTLMFFTVSLLVQVAFTLLRIQSPRLRMLGYLLPFCKLAYDLFAYRFSNWALLHGINPLEAFPGTRELSLSVYPFFIHLQLHLQNGLFFSVADTLALSLHPHWILAIGSLAALGSFLACLFFWIHLRREQKQVDHIIQEAFFFTPLFKRQPLQNWITKRSIRFGLSEAIVSPCAIGSTILFPSQLHQSLSQEELEAVIAHESAHIQWGDRWIRLGASFFASLFWWIPTRWHLKAFQQMQETGADQAILRWNIPASTLAQAILKTLKTPPCKAPLQQAIYFVENRSSLQQRLLFLLQRPSSTRMLFLRNALFMGLLGSLLFGRIWTF